MLDATRRSQKRYQLYIVINFKKLITNLLTYNNNAYFGL